MTSNECTIEVHVRRTGEVLTIKVTPMLTTFGDILKIVCEKIQQSEPSHYYITLNYESEMQDDMLFEPRHIDKQFQLIMRTKWLLEYIAEQTMQKQQIKVDIRQTDDTEESVVEISPEPATTSDESSQESETIDASIPSEKTSDSVDSTSENSTKQNKVILSDVVRSTIRRIPKRAVQKYLHKSLGKSFDILLMGSPRVGKSTLINAILKKDIAQTSAGRNPCTATMSYYEYEESYTTSDDDDKISTTSTCSIRIWDAPGCFADLEHIKIVIEQCKNLQVFIALVVTNMYASDEVDDILESFKTLLTYHSIQTRNLNDVFYFGTIGLCTAVNSVEFKAQGTIMKPAGIDELMLGIMNSLSEEKLLQWCFALMDNGPFWIRAQSRIWKTFNVFKRWIGY